MDKKLSRQILYRPGKKVSEVLSEKANVQVENIDTTPKKPPVEKPKKEVVPKPAETLLERSKRLYDWLDEHPLINLNGICQRAGVDRANFIKGMGKNKELKLDILEKLINELKHYGYAE